MTNNNHNYFNIHDFDVIILGGGAAGLFCGIEAGKRNRKVLIIDHANKPGKKILMSGGGRCNFTNLHIHPDKYISHNKHFCKSALSRYTQFDFIQLVKKYKIPFHEKTLGQLFCDQKSQAIVDMLLNECEKYNVKINLNENIENVEIIENIKHPNKYFQLKTNLATYSCQSLVIATGGLSIPTMGASPFAYKVAEQFGIKIWPTRAGLVPLTLHPEDKEKYAVLTGIAVECMVSAKNIQFRENILFTHRGISGPAILQISSYWQPGEILQINLLPDLLLLDLLITAKQDKSDKLIKTFLIDYLPKRLIEIFIPIELSQKKIKACTNKDLENVTQILQNWQLKPNGTEGYRTAEVTLGGIDCNALSSKTMEVINIPNLYFIGEAVDVTGWLGGYNFQWAWSSAWAAGQVV